MNNIPFENYKNRLDKAIAIYEGEIPKEKQKYLQVKEQITKASSELEKTEKNYQNALAMGRSTSHLETLRKSKAYLLEQYKKRQESIKNRILQYTLLKNKLTQTQENLIKIQEGQVKLSNEGMRQFKNIVNRLFKEAKTNTTVEKTKNTTPLMNTTRSKRLGWCNAMGRCFEGFTARLTRKTKNNKKEGGKRKQTRKAK